MGASRNLNLHQQRAKARARVKARAKERARPNPHHQQRAKARARVKQAARVRRVMITMRRHLQRARVKARARRLRPWKSHPFELEREKAKPRVKRRKARLLLQKERARTKARERSRKTPAKVKARPMVATAKVRVKVAKAKANLCGKHSRSAGVRQNGFTLSQYVLNGLSSNCRRSCYYLCYSVDYLWNNKGLDLLRAFGSGGLRLRIYSCVCTGRCPRTDCSLFLISCTEAHDSVRLVLVNLHANVFVRLSTLMVK